MKTQGLGWASVVGAWVLGGCGVRVQSERDGAVIDAAEVVQTDAAEASVEASVEVVALRQIAPLSTSRVHSHRPRLRWEQPRGVTEVQVTLCRDRAMRVGCVTERVMGSALWPREALAVGLWYWSVRAESVGMQSPVWQFRVGGRDTLVDTSWGTEPDFNGDGFADVVVGASEALIDRESPLNGGGRVSVFYGGAAVGESSTVVLEGPPGWRQFGQEVASAGDVNGDGYADLMVASAGACPGELCTIGGVSVFLGGADGLRTTEAVLLRGLENGDRFGSSIASAGDVNGDGYADVVVGASGVGDRDRRRGGPAQVFYGSATGLSAGNATTIQRDFAGSDYSYRVSGAGDLNGDGLGDVLVTSVLVDPESPFVRGAGWVFYGRVEGVRAEPDLVLQGLYGAQGVGDVNGDGFADFMVGLPTMGERELSPGQQFVSVFYGSGSGVRSDRGVMPQGGVHWGANPWYLFGVGDLNGDGFDDVAQQYAPPSASSSLALVSLFYGSERGLPAEPVVVLENLPQNSVRISLAGAGDVNGDGIADLLVGTPSTTPHMGRGGAGRASLYLGSPGGLTSPAAAVFEGVLDGDRFGVSVARLWRPSVTARLCALLGK
ncbi:MAG: FG-GAP-like repeat-containing protein [Deltaproteobacteria bacterium]|nr:FG-GAP-like repeat-containing protein [Deltaproteobacteria bacterium]